MAYQYLTDDRNLADDVKTYKNRKESVEVSMVGSCLGYYKPGQTCVRPTVDGRFAVIKTIGDRLIKVFDDLEHAKHYNFAIHGDRRFGR